MEANKTKPRVTSNEQQKKLNQFSHILAVDLLHLKTKLEPCILTAITTTPNKRDAKEYVWPSCSPIVA